MSFSGWMVDNRGVTPFKKPQKIDGIPNRALYFSSKDPKWRYWLGKPPNPLVNDDVPDLNGRFEVCRIFRHTQMFVDQGLIWVLWVDWSISRWLDRERMWKLSPVFEFENLQGWAWLGSMLSRSLVRTRLPCSPCSKALQQKDSAGDAKSVHDQVF